LRSPPADYPPLRIIGVLTEQVRIEISFSLQHLVCKAKF
jgi:hypothetical protein